MSLNRSSIARITNTVSTLVLAMLINLPKVSAQSINKSPILPEGLGFAAHFTTPQSGEMDLLAKTGARIVRTDLLWHRTETEEGEYDFSSYDQLIRELEQRNMRALFILNYWNPLYDQGLPPYTEAGRQAFARWAAAAVQHFKGHNIIWEMWNEPNLGIFWKPQPNVDNYTKLALSVGKAIRSVSPNEIYIGAATAGVDFSFLEACFKAGLLNYWSGISVHPYRDSNLESVASDYRKLRLLIAKHAPQNKDIPILSSEWGYTSLWKTAAQKDSNYQTPLPYANKVVDEITQGKLLSRQWLHNLANNIPISIWYEWHDNGPERLNQEHHFGIVRYPYLQNSSRVYAPKPAYSAAKTLTTTLAGYKFNKRLNIGNPQDYVLLFNHHKSQNVRLAVWTTSLTPHLIQIPVSPGRFLQRTHTGSNMAVLDTSTNILSINATDAPLYVIPAQPNDLLQIAANWERIPLEIVQPLQKNINVTFSLKNPLPRAIQVSNGSQSVTLKPYQTVPLTYPIEVLTQTNIFPVNFRLDIPEMGSLSQSSLILNSSFLTGTHTPPPITEDSTISLAELVSNSGTDTFKLFPGGDTNTASSQSLSIVQINSSTISFPAQSVMKITYAFEDGWKYLQLTPSSRNAFKMIEGQPKAVGIWVYGDGSNNLASVRFTDATQQIFQTPFQAISWKGWRYITFPLDGITCKTWGGAGDGIIHHPIQWTSVFSIVSAKSQKTQGEIYLGNLTYIR